MNKRRVIVALDYPEAKSAIDLCRRLNPTSCRVKVGKALFTCSGPSLIEQLRAAGFDVFLDMKYHDIPNTVAAACLAAADLGVWMLNVHAAGGRAMLEAAREAIDKTSSKPLLVAVTVLTSLAQKDLAEIGINNSVDEQVMKLAMLARRSGLDGIVCSAMEARRMCDQMGQDFCLVTPGIRPEKAPADDQRRIMTPLEAMRSGSHYLVIGRPLTTAPDPLAMLNAINAEISGYL